MPGKRLDAAISAVKLFTALPLSSAVPVEQAPAVIKFHLYYGTGQIFPGDFVLFKLLLEDLCFLTEREIFVGQV